MSQSPFAVQPFWVEGLSAVAEYLRWKSAAIKEIHCNPKELNAIKGLIAEHGRTVPVMVRDAAGDKGGKDTGGAALRRGGRSESPHHKQGKEGRRAEFESFAPVAAKVMLSAVPAQEWFNRLEKNLEKIIIALDHVQDPRNLGAILRSAAFFGVRSILVPERRQVLLTQASVATAQGGFALCDLACTVNLSRALRDLKEHGYWIIGAAMDGEPMEKVAGVYEKVVLVLGAEDTGLSRSVDELCDRKVSIKGAGQLDSLNVSVAAGIVLNSFANSHLRS